MKAYLLFAGSHYYPLGGVEDYIGDFDSIEEAVEEFHESSYNWYQVVQHSDMMVCDRGAF